MILSIADLAINVDKTDLWDVNTVSGTVVWQLDIGQAVGSVENFASQMAVYSDTQIDIGVQVKKVKAADARETYVLYVSVEHTQRLKDFIDRCLRCATQQKAWDSGILPPES